MFQGTYKIYTKLSSKRTWPILFLGFLAISGLVIILFNSSAKVAYQTKFEQTINISQKLKSFYVPAVSIAVIYQGQIDWAQAYGTAQKDTLTPARNDTLFQACSISKPVSALAILELIQTGKLDLDENINNFLKGWHISRTSFSSVPAKLRKLLSHTAGFQTGRRPMYPQGHPLPTTLQILTGSPPALSGPLELEFTPGQKFQYSGAGYTVIQLILEEYYQKPFSELIKAHILEPLKMENSTFVYPVPFDMQGKIAFGYNEEGNSMPYPYYNIADLTAGGLWTTPRDLAKFILEIQKAMENHGKILTQPMVMEMLTPLHDSFGLGFRVGGSGENGWFAHGGDNAGYKALIFGFKNQGMGAVIMTNSDNGWPLCLEILEAIALLYNWPIKPPQSF